MISVNKPNSGPICLKVKWLSQKQGHCFWLKKTSDCWYKCYAHGFRYQSPGINGVCKKEKFYNLYDLAMLTTLKRNKSFCFYRFFAPIIVGLSIISIGNLSKILSFIWSQIQTN